MGDLKDRLVKDMALTPEDFARLLPKALNGWDYQISDYGARIGTPERGITISLAPLPSRVLGGLLVLQRNQVEIVFHGLDQAEQDSFLKRFDQAFRRGGG